MKVSKQEASWLKAYKKVLSQINQTTEHRRIDELECEADRLWNSLTPIGRAVANGDVKLGYQRVNYSKRDNKAKARRRK